MRMLIGAACWLALVLFCCGVMAGDAAAAETQKPARKVTPQGGDFTLESNRGPVSTVSFRGRVMLLYFGYTLCPDVCPTSLSLMAQALNELDADELKRVVGLFVSLDPARDTLDKLAAYAGYFHPSFIGVTGKPEAVAAVAKQYGVQYSFEDAGDSALGYSVDHSAAIYLVDTQGTLRFAFPHGTSPATLLGAIRMLLEGP